MNTNLWSVSKMCCTFQVCILIYTPQTSKMIINQRLVMNTHLISPLLLSFSASSYLWITWQTFRWCAIQDPTTLKSNYMMLSVVLPWVRPIQYCMSSLDWLLINSVMHSEWSQGQTPPSQIQHCLQCTEQSLWGWSRYFKVERNEGC